ncbi:MAG: hypothetical protein AAFZ65_11600, partial [Planctomycetota bacterium]
MPPPLALPRLLAWILLLALAACSSIPREEGRIDLDRPPRSAGEEEVRRQIAAMEAELTAGAPWSATRRGIALRRVGRLSSSNADRIDQLLEASCSQAAATAKRSSNFDALDRTGLPRRARAVFSIGHARTLMNEGEYFQAYLRIRDLESVHRTHHLRTQAGEVVFEAGVRLTEDKSRVLWIFPRSTNAPTILEYMVLQHPSHPRTPEAYLRLAGEYERRGQLAFAIERYEDLLLYHPQAAGTVEAEARVPQLRLDGQLRDDYDRGELILAKAGLERWLERHGSRLEVGDELVEQVRADLREATRRLASNDLIVARFYRRVDSPEGQRL